MRLCPGTAPRGGRGGSSRRSARWRRTGAASPGRRAPAAPAAAAQPAAARPAARPARWGGSQPWLVEWAGVG